MSTKDSSVNNFTAFRFRQIDKSNGKRALLELETAAQENSFSLEALAKLFQALHQQGVRYCHWKSNLRLEQALSGQTDLDLLVDRKHSQLFRRILTEYNIKPIVSAPGKHYPAIENYLGFDPASGKLFHLHVHYQLVLGEQFVKNYRLPLETYFLDSVQLRHGVQIPAPEWELIILSLRALLKYRDRDAVKDSLPILRRPGLPVYIVQEIEWLLGQTSLERIAEVLKEVAEVVPADIVLEFLQTVATTPRAGYQLFHLRNRLRRTLGFYQRDSRLQASLNYFQRIWRQRTSFLKFSPNRKLTPLNGGLTLALIGADGAGKSTMGQILFKWLAWKLDVHLYYLGSKQPSRLSKLLYLVFRIARRSHHTICRGLGEKNVLARLMAAFRQIWLYTYFLSIGYDRYLRYLAGRQKTTAGSIVIYDRYPLDVSLDGPKIHLAAGGQMGAIARLFSRLEQNLYGKFRLLDYLVVLDVSPEVSLQRKPDHNRAAVEAKSQVVRKLIAQVEQETGWLDVVRIDADQSFEEVLSQLKMAVWELI
jgi:thymidylate kinase